MLIVSQWCYHPASDKNVGSNPNRSAVVEIPVSFKFMRVKNAHSKIVFQSEKP